MKAYYYFLFRIYRLYKDKNKESDAQALFSATAVSTVIVSFILLFLHGVANYFDLLPMFTNKYYAAFFMIVIGFINHYLFVRGRTFLNYGFQKDKKGGILIVSFIIAFGILFIVFTNINRDRIFKERAGKISNEPRKESLEGKIRKWLE